MAGAFSKHRQQIWHSQQHPYKHNLAEFAYTNPVMPGVTNLEDVIDWLLAILYPMSQFSVPTTADLPVGGDVTFAGAGSTQFTFDVPADQMYSNGDQVEFSGFLPAELTANTIYYVQNRIGNNFELSTDKDGTSIITVAGAGGTITVENVLRSYRVVSDDGDGKAASYRWEQREGDVAPLWYKIYDMDWGQDAILAAFLNVTQDQYVQKFGKDDTDALGIPLVGISAGQHVYGGDSANTHLTLHANAGDGVGPSTGYVQFADSLRPTADAALDIGTLTERIKDLFASGMIKVSNLEITSDTIENLSEQLNINNSYVIFSDEAQVNSFFWAQDAIFVAINQIGFVPTTSVDNVSGSPEVQVSGGVLNITKGGIADVLVDALEGTFRAKNIVAKDGTATITMVADNGSGEAGITTTQAVINFGAANLKTTGTIEGGAITGTSLDVDDITIDGNTVSSSTDLNLAVSGAGKVNVKDALYVEQDAEFINGIRMTAGSAELNNVSISGNRVETSTGDLLLSAVGANRIEAERTIVPDADYTVTQRNLGSDIRRWFTGFFNKLSDGTNEILVETLTKFNNWGTPAVGHSLFWDGTKWVASAPDIEIVHNTVSGLTTGDAGHTQFAMLAGRAGSQTLQGGTGANEFLILESTSNAAKGYISVKDTVIPFTPANYSGSWQGIDLGLASHYLRNLFMRGEAFGLRPENLASNPAFSALNQGRLVYNSTEGSLYWDVGTHFRKPVLNTIQVMNNFGGTNIPTSEKLVLVEEGATTITTITAPAADTRMHVIVNSTGVSMTVTNNSGTANSIITGTGDDLTIAANASFIVAYDTNASRWRVVGGSGSGYEDYSLGNLSSTGLAITIQALKKKQWATIEGSGGPVTLPYVPFSAALDGTEVTLVGRSDTNTVTILPSNGAAYSVAMDGEVVLTLGKTVTFKRVDALTLWVRVN